VGINITKKAKQRKEIIGSSACMLCSYLAAGEIAKGGAVE
jgi:hypothetical protein